MGVTYLKVYFTRDQADADVEANRLEARRIAGRALRAIADTMRRGDATEIAVSVGMPADTAVTGSSLLRLAQEIDPIPQPINK